MNDPEITVLNLAQPGSIDGDPLEVEARVLSDLAPTIDALAEYLDEAAKQLANAERTRIVRADKGLDPMQIRQTYDASDRADSLRRLLEGGKQVAAAASELET
jgi:hypothetical protein